MSQEKSGPGQEKRRRRRRRRRAPRKDATTAAQAKAAEAGAAAAARALPGDSRVDMALPTDQPLSEDEAAVMRQHLAFIRRHRKALRLKLNATENLLIDGAREPEHRGVCKHLLSKINRAAAVAAMARKPICDDARARTQLLAGVARISGDVAVLLMYLEALAETADREAASAAFASTVERIDFSTLPGAQMRTLLSLLEKTFDGHAQVQVLFGLLQSDSFRETFDRSAEVFDEHTSQRFLPLRAVYATFIDRRARRRAKRERPSYEPATLEAGLRSMLAAPAKVLKAYHKDVRDALLRAALGSYGEGKELDAVTRALLETFPESSQTFRRSAFRWAKLLVRSGDERGAEALLRRIVNGHGQSEAEAALLEALSRPRVGAFALEEDARGSSDAGLKRAFWLDESRSVWLRLGRPEDAERFRTEATLQREACIPGVPTVLAAGTDEDGRPYVAFPSIGGPLLGLLPGRDGGGLSGAQAQELALEGVRILRSIALAGIRLPDCAPNRFMLVPGGALPRLLVADLDGARQVPAEQALSDHLVLARRWCLAALAFPPLQGKRLRREVPAPLRLLLEDESQEPSYLELVTHLDERPQPGRSES